MDKKTNLLNAGFLDIEILALICFLKFVICVFH